MSEADKAAGDDKEVLRFFYRRSDEPLNWYLWAEPGRPTIDQLVRQKQLAGAGAPQVAERIPQGNGADWAGIEAPATAIIERSGGGRHPVTLDKAYSLDMRLVAGAVRLATA